MPVNFTDNLPRRVYVVEVGPRDGLQNEKSLVPTEAKIRFVDDLTAAGFQHIEVTSFVNPKAVPQMADGAEVLKRIEKRAGVRYSVLIPNLKGIEGWLAVAPDLQPEQRAIALFTAASETFNSKNINATISESFDNFQLVQARLRTDMGSAMPFVRGYVSTAVRCPYEGPVEPEKVLEVSLRLLELGVNEISLGDTIGAATPSDIDRLLSVILAGIPVDKIALHLHDTRGTALANVLEAMRFGVATFDSSAGGLGGCPFAPGASGNLATEDLIYMLNGMSIETGVNLKAVAAASNGVQPFIGRQLAGRELQALTSAGF